MVDFVVIGLSDLVVLLLMPVVAVVVSFGVFFFQKVVFTLTSFKQDDFILSSEEDKNLSVPEI